MTSKGKNEETEEDLILQIRRYGKDRRHIEIPKPRYDHLKVGDFVKLDKMYLTSRKPKRSKK